MSSHTPHQVPELNTTIFLSPIIGTVFRWVSVLALKILGWKIVGEKPDVPKSIVVVAPHTSNWDFILFLFVAFAIRFDAHWMGKNTIFPWPIRSFMIWLGGIPIDRSKANNLVDQMVDYYGSVDQLTVLISPEGTRSKVGQWKTGFYHIAHQAKLPLILAFIDVRTKTIGFGPRFEITGDVDADIKKIQAFYRGKQGLIANNF